ncbi:hypothetical protein SMICM17S_06316 [Streptomyces microflavus]
MVHGLRAAGMREGDAFAVVLPNGTELLTAHLAASRPASTWYRSTTTSSAGSPG